MSSFQAARCGGTARHKPVMRREGHATGRSLASRRSQPAARGSGVSGGRGWRYTIPASAVVDALVPAITAAPALADHGIPSTANLTLSADGSTHKMDRLSAGFPRSAGLSLRNVPLASVSGAALFGRGRPPLCFNTDTDTDTDTDTCGFRIVTPTSSGSYRLRTIVYPDRGRAFCFAYDDYSERLDASGLSASPHSAGMRGSKWGAVRVRSRLPPRRSRYNVGSIDGRYKEHDFTTMRVARSRA
jgi:hypothetical protein